MTTAANKKPHPVKQHSTDELLKVMHGAVIGHREALEDALNFNRKIGQCIDEMGTRIARDGFIGANPDEMRRLRDALSVASKQIESLGREDRTPNPSPRPKPIKRKSPYPAQVIQRQIRELLESGLSYQEVANALNSEGHTTRRGNTWNYSSVYALAAYMGVKKQ